MTAANIPRAERTRRSHITSWALADRVRNRKPEAAYPPITEFVPPGCWVTSANRRGAAGFHRVDYGLALWFEEDQPWLGGLAMCGAWFGYADFHIDLPDDAEFFCEPCIFADWTPPIVVYRFFDASDRLLYVGCTSNFLQRVSGHKGPTSPSPWWPLAVRHTLTEYPTFRAALSAEAHAICTEGPIYNRHRVFAAARAA